LKFKISVAEMKNVCHPTSEIKNYREIRALGDAVTAVTKRG
jgi:hypothetical protein